MSATSSATSPAQPGTSLSAPTATIDDNQGVYTVQVLLQMKQDHERVVSVGGRAEAGRVSITNSEFIMDVSDADRVVGMEVNQPATLSGVLSTVKAKNVREAIGFSTNQGLTGMITTCPSCGHLVPAAFTGPPPPTVKCPRCGREVPTR